ncbi:MAG: phytoene/squalene synthase family protein [Candidatus Thermoplasmatota archaeon]|nr:phytoene/squalene synthase family protein [Candidatus Thermoplasmatota archaeon]
MRNDSAAIDQSYLECERIANDSSSSFLRAFRTLPKEKRDGIKALYAFCRRADDVADGDWMPDFSRFSPQQMGSLRFRALQRSKVLDEKHQSRGTLDHDAHIARLCALIYLRDNIQPIENDSFPKEKFFLALWHTIERFDIPSQHLHSLIDGMEDDLYPTNYQTYEDLHRYCYNVASSVGLCLLHLYGYEGQEAEHYADEMGVFLQMVNILRDIQSDLASGRIYLPVAELQSYGISASELSSPNLASNPNWQEFMQDYILRCKAHREEAVKLLPLIHPESRKSPSIMVSVYSQLVKQAEKLCGDVVSQRLGLTVMQKANVLMSTLGVISITHEE